MTAQQVGGRPTLQPYSLAGLYKQALEDAGHVVDLRACEPEMPLDEYDTVLMGFTSLTALGAQHAYGALDVIARARSSGCKLVLYLDDWKVREVWTQLRNVVKAPDRLTKPLFSYKRHYEWAVEHRPQLDATAAFIYANPWPRALVPMFEWGDRALLAKVVNVQELICVDPSSYAPRYPVNRREPDGRERIWVSGALTESSAWLRKLQHQWPIQEFGHRKKGQERLKEPDLVQRYAEVWGSLSTPYYHAGSGWWRYRFLAAAHAGCLTVADPREVGCLGQWFAYPALQLEQLSPGQLQHIAQQQAAQLAALEWPSERLQEALSKLVSQ